MLQNVAAGLWVVLLIGVGCFVLNAFAESAQRDECVMRGCTNILPTQKTRSEPQMPGRKEHAGIGRLSEKRPALVKETKLGVVWVSVR